MPIDMNELAPTLAAASLEPAVVSGKLKPEPVPEVPAPGPVSHHVRAVWEFYEAGEHDVDALARMTSTPVDTVNTIVGEIEALKTAIAADPAADVVSTYAPPEQPKPGGGPIVIGDGDGTKIGG